MTDVYQRQLGEPDRSLVGQPLFLHIVDKGIDECVEKAATIALDQPTVPIIAVRFTADPALRSLINGWLDRQRKALSAWRAQQGISGDQGRLQLRSMTATDSDVGSDWLWAYVTWNQGKQAHNA